MKKLPALPDYAPTPDQLLTRILERVEFLAEVEEMTDRDTLGFATMEQDETLGEEGRYLAEEVGQLSAWLAAGGALPQLWSKAAISVGPVRQRPRKAGK